MQEQKKSEKTGAEVQLVIFRLAQEEFGLDISQVREIIRMQNITPMPKAPEFIEGVINLRGQIIAVMDLLGRFGLKKENRTDKARIIVSEIKGNALGLIVSEVPEVLRISEHDIDPTPQMIESQINAEFIRGVGKAGERLIILLDIDKLLSSEEVKQVTKTSKKEE